MFLLLLGSNSALAAADLIPGDSWPEIRREAKSWAYWWWMGSAVDKTNITRELQRYHDAGLGGVHIIPIYGAKGYESRFIDYLSPDWMQMLAHTVNEAQRLDMGVDMTMGSGWCFGGPRVTEQEANGAVVVRKFELSPAGKMKEKLNPKGIQALMAFSPEGKSIDLLEKLDADGSLNWSPQSGDWQLYAVSQRPSGQKVKRAAPGGQGHMLNLFYPSAMRHYLEWFDDAFAQYHGPNPRALYHDSYEYKSDWAPDFFASFEKRRVYKLQTELPALFADSASGTGPDSRITHHASRITRLRPHRPCQIRLPRNHLRLDGRRIHPSLDWLGPPQWLPDAQRSPWLSRQLARPLCRRRHSRDRDVLQGPQPVDLKIRFLRGARHRQEPRCRRDRYLAEGTLHRDFGGHEVSR
jgi:hypothetical protein